MMEEKLTKKCHALMSGQINAKTYKEKEWILKNLKNLKKN